MRLRFISLVGIIFLVSPLFAVQKNYVTASIISVEPKINTRVLYYIVNTPVTRDAPYFELSIRLKDTLYITEYVPRHSSESLPEGWKPEAEVQARVEKRHMFVKRADGEEVDLTIVKRKPAAEAVQNLPAK